MSTEPSQRPRTALAISEIFGGFLVIVGLIVGLTSHQTMPGGGLKCGSVLGGADGPAYAFAACERALSTPTLWTWLLLILGALVLIAGWVIDAIQKNAYVAQRSDVAPA